MYTAARFRKAHPIPDGRIFCNVNKFKCMPTVEKAIMQAPLLLIELLYAIYIYICILSELITLAYTFHLISVDSLVISRIYEMPTQSSIIKIHLSGLQGDISMLSTSNKHIFGPEYAAQIFLCTHNRGRKRTERSRLEFQVIRNTFTLENQHAMSQTLF